MERPIFLRVACVAEKQEYDILLVENMGSPEEKVRRVLKFPTSKQDQRVNR